MSIKSVTLLSGRSAPWIAYGTGSAHFQKNCSDATKTALSLGFRHLDTAQLYHNEEHVGSAIEWAVSGGVANLKREDLFITTKLDAIPPGKNVEDTLRISLEKLKVEYVDMFLIHIPAHHFEREGSIEQVWREMVAVKAKGLTKSIGVSNFNKSHLERIIALGIEKPEVNQIEYHAFVAKRLEYLLEYSNAQGIITASYGGLTPILPRRGDNELAETRPDVAAVLERLAKARGNDVTQGQILLKWLEKKNVIAVTTSSKESRMKEYLAAQNLQDLTDEDAKAIVDACGNSHFRAYPSVYIPEPEK